MKFSERNGYIEPSDVIIVGKLTPEVENSICNCFIDLLVDTNPIFFRELERSVQRYCLNSSIDRIPSISNIDSASYIFGNKGYQHLAIIPFISNKQNEWWKKIDIIEYTITNLSDNQKEKEAINFVSNLNGDFERLNFGYRILHNSVIQITSDVEMQTIERALDLNNNSVKIHLHSALEALAIRPVGDYRNSIKESISAVEAFNRKITGEKVLNFSKMESLGLKIPSVLRNAFEKLYGYSNDETTGIRHSLMDESGKYVPGADEAQFMLITCSAFINYLNNKLKISND
jgi:hypothetical protein